MSDTKHTPGPWEARNNVGAGLEIFAPIEVKRDATDRDMIREPYPVFVMRPTDSARCLIAYEQWTQFPTAKWDAMQSANARLIAAAPELLSALCGLLSEVEASGNGTARDFGWPAAVKASHAAIAKAVQS